jgi:hypothetical protein
MRKLMKRYGRPGEIVTDKLRSYGAALGHLLIAQTIDVFAFWDVLPDQTIGIFVEVPSD